MKSRLAALAPLAMASLIAASCSSGAPQHRAITTDKLEPYSCGSVKRLHTYGGIFLASQPEKEDFKQAKDGGVKTVINLRRKDELSWDEEAAVKELGLEYHHVPFKAPEELTDEVFDRTRNLLRDSSKKPILLHCASANRVGAIWLVHRAVDDGLSFESAMEEARVVGLKMPAYEEKAKAYIAKHKPK